MNRNLGRIAAAIGLAAVVGLASGKTALGQNRAEAPEGRSGYTYLRLVTGDATVDSQWNGRVEARRNMPISAGDEISVSDAGRVEVGLADGNVLQIGGGSRAGFVSLHDQQGEDDELSAISVREGSVILAAIGRNENEIPRIDTDDATIYVDSGSRVRVNVDPRRGTSVIARAGSIEVRSRAGTYKLRGGQYLMVRGDEEPEIERGSFSRDRFDIWASERMDQISESTRTVSARYVDQEYSSDVEALDGYGDWNYSPTYSTYVWTPHVEISWTPYSFGTWYYTPAGLTWWSYDPWGWYPHHYGNWFFEAAWNRWCWAPAYVYSPAWVYWAYSGNYVGWCPTGWYSGFGPWWNTYYRRNGWARADLYFSLHGTFRPREVDFRGWNFTGANRFGAGHGRAEIIPGSRISGQLGSQVAISSRPIVVNARPGGAREAIRDWVREAPRVIERAGGDSSRLAPILGRQRELPASTVDALRDRTVVAERGRLAGAAAAELAPRGARVERGRGSFDLPGGTPGAVERGRVSERPSGASGERIERAAPVERAPRADEGWRGRERGRIEAPQASPAAPGRSIERDSRPRDFRSREVPPARRVIEGSVPGRRVEERRPEFAPRPEAAPREYAPREYAPRDSAPRYRPEVGRREMAPPPRAESRPAPAPPPRAESRPSSPPPSNPHHGDRGRKD